MANGIVPTMQHTGRMEDSLKEDSSREPLMAGAENAPQAQTSRLQRVLRWWRAWRQGTPPRHTTPTTLHDAVEALNATVSLTGVAVTCSAYGIKRWGWTADYAYAATMVELVDATATAAYAVAAVAEATAYMAPSYPYLREAFSGLVAHADAAQFAADRATAAVAGARGAPLRQRWFSLSALVALLMWPFPKSLQSMQSLYPYNGIPAVVDRIAAAAATAGAAADTAIDAAAQTDKTTTTTAAAQTRGEQTAEDAPAVPCDAHDAFRLHAAYRLAQATAAAARAAAHTVRFTHPLLSLRTARTARAAAAAARRATMMRLRILEALAPVQVNGIAVGRLGTIGAWLENIERFRSPAVQFHEDTWVHKAFFCSDAIYAAGSAKSAEWRLRRGMESGQLTVASVESVQDASLSSSVTLGFE